MNIGMLCGEVFVCRMLRGTLGVGEEKSDSYCTDKPGPRYPLSMARQPLQILPDSVPGFQ
jgi:hypothetical protein